MGGLFDYLEIGLRTDRVEDASLLLELFFLLSDYILVLAGMLNYFVFGDGLVSFLDLSKLFKSLLFGFTYLLIGEFAFNINK